jgi:hypothetical protein
MDRRDDEPPVFSRVPVRKPSAAGSKTVSQTDFFRPVRGAKKLKSEALRSAFAERFRRILGESGRRAEALRTARIKNVNCVFGELRRAGNRL